MLDIKFIRANKEIVKKAVIDKNVNLDIDKLLLLEQDLRNCKNKIQNIKQRKNEIAKLIPTKDEIEKTKLISEGKEVNRKVNTLQQSINKIQVELDSLLLQVPNIPSKDAPIGHNSDDNKTIKIIGDLPQFNFTPKDHKKLLDYNNWAEFKGPDEIAGARSYTIKGELLLIENAIHRLVWKKLITKGFDLLSTPSFGREYAFTATGHFPKGKDQMYLMEKDNLYLTGTSEIFLNAIHKNQILSENQLPIKYAGYSACFRREAGSAGRDVGGLMRVHQFNKTEQYIICKNDISESIELHNQMLQITEDIMNDLKLPYRIVECCTGDMGLGKFKMNDIEAWIPSEGKYRETHSGSILGEWQARRTNLRYRDNNGKIHFCHTLNCTGVATPRILIPLLEIHQQEDQTIKLPEALKRLI